jgi:hypothetical protein
MNAEGWFPDPERPGRLRYFDGTHWTGQYDEHTRAAPVGPPIGDGEPPAPTPGGKSFGMKLASLFGVAGLGTTGKLAVAAGLMVSIGLLTWGITAEVNDVGDDSDDKLSSPRVAAQIIWDAEAEEFEFCTLYWGLPSARFYEEVMLVRASGLDDRAAVADQMMTIAALECPEP